MTSGYDILELTDEGHAAWDAFVETCDEASFFHRAGWRNVIRRSFGQRPRYFYAARGGKIVGLMPLVEMKSRLFGHALISNAFCVCGGPIATDEGARNALTAHAEQLLRECGADYLEVRCPVRPIEGWTTRDNLYAAFSKEMAGDEAANLTQIPRKQRAVVRKALESGMTYDLDPTTDRLHRLYAISVRNLGTPVFGKSYFANLLSEFADDCDVLTVSDNGAPLASVLSFYFKGSVMPFYTGSSPLARGRGANDLMYWRLMRHAVARGCTVFDFGRSKVGTGPYNFKKNWGFEPSPITHQFLMRPGVTQPNLNPLNPKFALMIAVWKRLPLPVANVLGPLIVRNIG